MNHTLNSSVASSSLLDRLSECCPAQVAAATLSRGELQAENLRESIVRNLNWLLNTTRMEASFDLKRWPNVRKSVLNFGVPEFLGQLLTHVDATEIERQVKEAILRYEPRLLPNSLRVEVFTDHREMNRRSLQFSISGSCLESEVEYNVNMTAEVDLETGRVARIR